VHRDCGAVGTELEVVANEKRVRVRWMSAGGLRRTCQAVEIVVKRPGV
jgi:hypothetical protein